MVTTDKAILDAQVAILGSMLIDERCIGPTLAEVDPQDFSNPVYKTVYLTIRRMFAAGETVDPVTVVDSLKGDKSGDWYELAKQLMDLTPTSANVMEYVKILRRDARLRRMQILGMTLAGAVDMDTAGDAVSKINAEMVERQGLKAMTMEEGLQLFYERRKQTPEYLPWGLSDLDGKLYAERGDYIIIGGAPSDGKTALALASAWRQSEKYHVGFFSLETGKGKAIDRLMAHVAQIEMASLKHNTLSEEDYQTVADLSPRILSRHLEIVPAANATVTDMFAYAQARRYEIIYIDHVQIIKTDSRRDRYAEMTRISGEIHTNAQATGITAVVLSQLSRAEKNGKPRPPVIQDLRETGALEQDADIIMLLYRNNPKDRMDPRRMLDVGKNKEGELGSVPLIFDGPTQTFRRNYNYVPPKKEEEPEYKQLNFSDLPPDTEVPFDTKEGK